MSYNCTDCGRDFRSPRGLGSHRFAFHGIKGRSPAAVRRDRKGLLLRKPRALVVEPGEVYGMLTVLEECNEPNPNGEAGRTHTKVRCNCGTVKLVAKALLLNGRTVSCGCHREKKKAGSAWRALHVVLCRGARLRDLSVELTPDHIRVLGEMNCFYCGRGPSNERYPRRSYRTIYNGIDRAENDKGYLIGNVLPCCLFCNRAKRDYSLERFIEQLQRYGSQLNVADARQRCIEVAELLRGTP